jgi:transcriptional regulator with GAF, ATPase, and Fis domain
MILASPIMRAIATRARLIAGSGLPLMLTGPTGAGKTELARHASRERRFVDYNLAELPASLAESVLFGHVRGAFSGATTDAPGLFVQAGRGVLFLDEVCELAPALQPKLLRAVESGRVRPVGARAQVETHCALITATNRDPWGGSLREDLAWRLAPPGAAVEVPPLRGRDLDILALARHFSGRTVAPEVAAVLVGHHWPGNVRELAHACRSAVLFELWSPAGLRSLLCSDVGTDISTAITPCRMTPGARSGWDRLAGEWSGGTLTRPELERRLGRCSSIVWRYLSEWRRLGLVERLGAGPTTRYALTARGES